MATESDVDIRSAHPYWAYPFNDISVVHNGQLTNYWINRAASWSGAATDSCRTAIRELHRRLSRRTIASKATRSKMRCKRSIRELDGVFTYLVATGEQLGMAKDTMAAKPMVLYESDESRRACLGRSRDPHAIFRARSIPPIPMTERCAYGRIASPNAQEQRPMTWACTPSASAAARSSAFFDVDSTSETASLYPSACDVDFNKRAEFDASNMRPTAINLRISELMSEGNGTIVIHNPGAKHSLGVGILNRLQLYFEGSLGYFGCGLIDGPNVRIKGRVGWSCAREHDAPAPSSSRRTPAPVSVPRSAAAISSARATSARRTGIDRKAARSSSAATPAPSPAS